MIVLRFLLAGLLLSIWATFVEAQQSATAAPQKAAAEQNSALQGSLADAANQNTDAQKGADAQNEKEPELCQEKCGTIRQLHRLGGIYLAGQPSVDDLREARQRGIRTVVTLRKPEEIDWDEQAAAEKLGFQYYSIPFRSPESLTDDIFDKARKVLSDKERRPLMLHCGTANRVGAVWLAYRVLDEGVPAVQALDEAKTVGLRTPAYVDKAVDYINRRQKPKG